MQGGAAAIVAALTHPLSYCSSLSSSRCFNLMSDTAIVTIEATVPQSMCCSSIMSCLGVSERPACKEGRPDIAHLRAVRYDT